jgi:hypothetical protein
MNETNTSAAETSPRDEAVPRIADALHLMPAVMTPEQLWTEFGFRTHALYPVNIWYER